MPVAAVMLVRRSAGRKERRIMGGRAEGCIRHHSADKVPHPAQTQRRGPSAQPLLIARRALAGARRPAPFRHCVIPGEPMAKVELYSTASCMYCLAAKNFLKQRGYDYEEIRVDTDPGRLAEMLGRTNQRSVPQVIID